jgi:TolB protein
VLKRTLTLILAALAVLTPMPASAQEPLRLEITEGVIEPLPFALPTFIAADGGASDVAQDITRVIAADLRGTGLFRQIPPDAYISQVTSFDSAVQYPDWQAINAQALITGEVETRGDQVVVRFRLYDVFSQAPLGEGLQFVGEAASWRRMAHTVADEVYERITGETGYFDTRVVFIHEEGPKNARLKRLAIMDYDGANVQFLTDSRSLVLAPRFSPQGDRILYTSYESGFPAGLPDGRGHRLRRPLEAIPAGNMTFAPRFSPDGNRVVFSLEQGGNSDIYMLDLATGQRTQLTNAPSIETAPSFSPDGSQIVFESDRTGNQQIYVMPAGRRGRADQPRHGPLRHAGLEPARRLHRLHQAGGGALPHRGDAHRRVGGTAADGVLPRRGADMGAQRPRHHVHARDGGGRWRAGGLFGRSDGAEPAAGGDARHGIRPRVVALAIM